MKLLHIIATADPASGGPIEAVIRIEDALAKSRPDISQEVATLDQQTSTFLRSFPVPIYPLGHHAGKLSYISKMLTRYRYSSQLVPWLRSNAGKYDAIVVHGLWNYASAGAWLGLRSSNTPFFVFVHGMLDPWFSKGRPIKTIMKRILWVASERHLLENSRAVLFTGRNEMDKASQAFRSNGYNGQVVGLGTAEPPLISSYRRKSFRAEFGLKTDFILFLGRLHPKKGVDHLLRGFRLSDSSSTLLVAGGGEKKYIEELNRLTRDLGLQDRVIFSGPLYGESKWAAMQECAAFILMSYQENFGISVAEALACGKPVLISRSMDISDIVSEHGSGIVDEATADGSKRVIDAWSYMTNEEREMMCRSARDCYERFFDIQRTALEFLNTLERNLPTRNVNAE